MEIQIYNPYDSPTLAERLLNRRFPNSVNRLQNSFRSNLSSDRSDRFLHRRQNRFRNLNRFGEQEIIISDINLFTEFIKNDAAIKIQKWYKRYNFNKKYIKLIQFIDR